jgi:hypothetical protein
VGSSRARRTGRLAVLAVLIAAAGVAAASAEGAIRLHSGIGRVSLGMSEAQVRAVLGRPDSVRRARAGATRILVLDYTMTGAFRVTLRGPLGALRATTVVTRSRRERTPAGVGVGSRERALRAAYPSIRCRDVRPRGSRVPIRRDCLLGSLDRRHTLFTIGRGPNPPVVLEVAVRAPSR